MKLTITNGFFGLALSLLTTLASAQAGAALPPAGDVVAKMMQFDAQRQSPVIRRQYGSPNMRAS